MAYTIIYTVENASNIYVLSYKPRYIKNAQEEVRLLRVYGSRMDRRVNTATILNSRMEPVDYWQAGTEGAVAFRALFGEVA